MSFSTHRLSKPWLLASKTFARNRTPISMRPFPDPRHRSADRLYSPGEIVRSGLCIGCGSCAAQQTSAEMRWDKQGFLKPAGPDDWYSAPSEFVSEHCPFSPRSANEDVIGAERFPAAPSSNPAVGRFEAAYVGHVAEDPFRPRGSSGGLTSWVAAELLRKNMVDAVAHVVPAEPAASGRFFEYRISRDPEAVLSGAKSRYYPVELSQVLKEIRATPGRYALVGIPCFIKAIHLLRSTDKVIQDRVTHTLGLFCGHMKSAAMVESFAWQLGSQLASVRAVDYRRQA